MHIERSFAHLLEAGGMRRTTLRGGENLNKRYKLAAAISNLSQLLRTMVGFGTPKQLAAAMARAGRALFCRLAFFLTLAQSVLNQCTEVVASACRSRRRFFHCEQNFRSLENAVSSTGC